MEECDRCGWDEISIDFENPSWLICNNCEKRFPMTDNLLKRRKRWTMKLLRLK
uniref:Uncharacterized protein n=1 Tax=viral metagenome TaxID=1070528 RepID=A0A6M3ISD5_9ZZZZ